MDELIEALAAAPHQAGGWAVALGRLARATGSSGGQLLGLGGPLALRLGGDRVRLSGDRERRRGMVALIVSERPRGASPDDTAIVRPSRPNDLAGESGVGILRRREDGPVTPRQIAAIARAAPAILSALRAQDRLEDQAAGHMVRTFGAMDLAAMVFDASGKLRAASSRVRQQFGDDPGLRLIEGRLKCAHADDQRRLEEALSAALIPRLEDQADGCRTLALGGRAARNGHASVLTVIRRETDEASISHLPHAIVLLRGRAPTVPPTEVIGRALGLTGGEAAVALQIAEGKGREAIAAERGVAPATVQAQLRSIFAKVGVNRELALALMVHRLMEI